MTKQEEMKEVIDAYSGEDCLYLDNDCEGRKGGWCLSDGAFECLLKRLDELGVVIKVDKELPKLHPNICFESNPGAMKEEHKYFRQAQQEMLIAGYVAVEPLIKEK